MKRLFLNLRALALLGILPVGTRGDVVTDWNQQLERATKTNALSAAVQARPAAIMHVAIYDAVNGVARQYEPYIVHESAPVGASAEAAAAQAGYLTLRWLFPNLTTNFEAALTTSLIQITNAGTSSSATDAGLTWGASVANRVIAWRAQDGFTNAKPLYFGGTNIGQWRSVPAPSAPDGSLPAIVPQMPTLVPFAMTSPSQFRPGPPYGLPLAEALASPQYAADLNEVKTIGRIASATRTAEQTSLARLWQASSTAELNNCLRQVLPAGNSLVDNARLFALANIVAADALIAGFDSKYTDNFWRPHHAIRFADQDGNPATEADPDWNALIIAPRHQEYISNHAVHSGGFVYALARLLGDAHTFTLSAVDFPGYSWTFHSFSEAAVQVKEARIWGGIHYRHSCEVGEVVGHRIVDHVLDQFLRPATPLAITAQPQSRTNIAGTIATFSVVATGTRPLSYQWILNSPGNLLPGATNDTLSVTNVQVVNEGVYRVNVTDAFGATIQSSSARLTVVVAPAIVGQPMDKNVVAGESNVLQVVAEGTPRPSFQWSFNEVPIAGATSSNLPLANVQSSDAGGYQVVVTNLYGAVTSRVATVTVAPATLYTRVTTGPVAERLSESTGAVWADFNNDGWLDLYVLQFGYPGVSATNAYFQNNGGGNFTPVTEGDFLRTDNGSLGVAAVDYDNDGYPDLAVATGGCCDGSPGHHFLFHNDGDGRFTRVTAGGLGDIIGYFVATDWADYDGDGFLDAFISEGGFTSGTGWTNQLWHNDGNGAFSRVTSSPIATDRGFASGALWFDYDSDGRPDLLTLNLSPNGGAATNYLYHNEGKGNFTRDITSPFGAERLSGGSEGADWGDYDNDGLLDLFVADGGGARSHLYHNNGGGSFSNVTAGVILTPPVGSEPHGATWGDYDNDGYLDLVVVHAERNVLYRNDRDGTFTEMRGAGFANDTVTGIYFFNNVSWVDYDNDGFLDLHFCLGHQPPSIGSARPNYLYHNAGNSNAWLEVKCVGTLANRSAIGARIRVKATVDGKTFWQVREIKSSAGWDVATPLIAHFGLGDATNVETLRIEWPSGTVQQLHNVTSKQILTVTEPPRLTATKVSGQPEFALKGGRYMNYNIEGSVNLHDWSPVTTVTITNLAGTAAIVDTSAPAGHRFYRAVQP